MGNKEMFCAYKSILIGFFLLFLFISSCYAEISKLSVSSTEIANYAVNDVIIIENTSYKINEVNVDAGFLRVDKNINNNFDLNVIQGTSTIYPLPVDFAWPGNVDDFLVLSQNPIGTPAYVNDLNIALLEKANSYTSNHYMIYNFLTSPPLPPNFNGRIEVYVFSLAGGALPIEQLIKIYDKVGDAYVARGSNFVLSPVIDYAQVGMIISYVLVFANVIMLALTAIFSVRKSMRLINNT